MMQISLLSCDLVLLELVLQDPAALEERFGSTSQASGRILPAP